MISTAQAKKILMIDDDAAIRESTLYFLENEGYSVTVCNNGADALRLFEKQPYDLVITDLMMPGKDGLDVILEMKKVNLDVKILAVSGADMRDELLDTATMFGAMMMLAKPFTRQQLIRCVADMFKK